MGQYNILSDAITVPSSMGRLLTTLIGMRTLHIVAYPCHSHTFRLQEAYFQTNTFATLHYGRESSGVAVAFQKPSAEFDDNT